MILYYTFASLVNAHTSRMCELIAGLRLASCLSVFSVVTNRF
jgi:hypothetical protein